ncbi:MAG TPA: YciI family protein [Allosphingosinicella sp.]|nr:YciI family protein [Allosphingosinicella sp.]
MEIYAIWRRRAGAWKQGEPIEAQDDWPGHAAFMMKGQADGIVKLAGPVDDKGALIVVRAKSPEAVEAWLAADPWTASGLLVTERIARWTLRIGSLA